MTHTSRAAFLAIANMCIIGLMSIVAIRLHLYSFTWWYDDIVHILAGTVICYFYFVFRRYFVFIENRIGLLFSVIIFAFVVGVGWEIFEAIIRNGGGGIEGFWIDTAADLTGDVFGAIAAYFIITTKKNIT